MDSQLILTVAFILVALAYLLRQLFRVFRSWRAGSCGNTCGCPSQSKPTNLPLITQLTLKPKRC
jgi:hypothetical protein